MTIEDASHLVTINRAEQDLINDPSMDLQTKVKTLSAIQNAAAYQPPSKPWLTMGEVVQGAVGAGLGYGASTLLGKFLGANPSTLNTMRTLGMGFGTLLNMGKIAMESSPDLGAKLLASKTAAVETDRRNAFRYGFTKQAMELGLFQLLQLPVFKTAGANFVAALPLGPDTITAPINAGINIGSTLASNAGALAGSLTAPDSTDEKMTKMLLARRELEGQADDLQAQHRQQILKQVLAKRYQH